MGLRYSNHKPTFLKQSTRARERGKEIRKHRLRVVRPGVVETNRVRSETLSGYPRI